MPRLSTVPEGPASPSSVGGRTPAMVEEKGLAEVKSNVRVVHIEVKGVCVKLNISHAPNQYLCQYADA